MAGVRDRRKSCTPFAVACNLTRKRNPVGPYRIPMPRVLGGEALSHKRGTPIWQVTIMSVQDVTSCAPLAVDCNRTSIVLTSPALESPGKKTFSVVALSLAAPLTFALEYDPVTPKPESRIPQPGT